MWWDDRNGALALELGCDYARLCRDIEPRGKIIKHHQRQINTFRSISHSIEYKFDFVFTPKTMQFVSELK